MNSRSNYSLSYASSVLHTLVRIISDPFSTDCNDDRNPISVGSVIDFSDAFISDPLMKFRDIYDLAARHPLIFTIENLFSYCLIKLKKDYILIGPVRFETTVYHRYIFTMNSLNVDTLPEDFDYWSRSVPLCSFDSFISIALLLANEERSGDDHEPFYSKIDITEKNCVDQSTAKSVPHDLALTSFNNAEDGFVHNPYNHEVRECHCVETGDLEGLQKVLSEDFTGRLGKVGFDPLRQEINIGIVTITIASRAAIRGGLHYEQAFYISDISIQKMEQCHDVATVKQIYRNAEFQYCSLVHELKAQSAAVSARNENKNISRCKDYISSHLHGKITVQEIAAAIGLESNYLSALFKKQEQITLKNYILREKIRLIKNLLTYSQYSYIKIATYLGFSSQSHLCREFKKETGMTPREYRERFTPDDFAKDSLAMSWD